MTFTTILKGLPLFNIIRSHDIIRYVSSLPCPFNLQKINRMTQKATDWSQDGEKYASVLSPSLLCTRLPFLAPLTHSLSQSVSHPGPAHLRATPSLTHWYLGHNKLMGGEGGVLECSRRVDGRFSLPEFVPQNEATTIYLVCFVLHYRGMNQQ